MGNTREIQTKARTASHRQDPACELTLAEREAAVLAREQMADRREQAAQLAAERREQADAELREANEQLVIATIRARTITAVAEHTAAEMSLKAERDFLTGLPNRALLTDRLAQSIALAKRHSKKVALMFIDIDHFKEVNDSKGHAVGDLVLQSVAQRMQACIRGSDTVSRQGGDEFVVLLNEINAAGDALIAADKLIRTVAKGFLVRGHNLDVTLSIGVSIFPDDGKDAEAVLANADTAMYCAKRSGGNNCLRYIPQMNARLASSPPRT
jgi:diguanylate cyclase (GGDEF)-like protein